MKSPVKSTAKLASETIGRKPLEWLQRVRLRALATVLAVAIAAFGLIAWAALPVLPVLGVAVAAVAMAINSVTARLNDPLCRDCGEDLANLSPGEYGVVCPSCGLINPIETTGQPDRLA